jgi:ANTAR domain-containing protein/GAF domain-containing protein
MSGGLNEALDALARSGNRPEALSEPFVAMFPVSGAAVSTVGALLGSETISATNQLAAKVDELQFDLGEGPCWDALSSNQPVLEPELRTRPRRTWPAFTPAIEREDVASLFAFPLVLGTLRIGAVDLYSSDPVDLNPTQTEQAVVMAAMVGRQVLRRALEESGVEYANEGNAHSRRVVHQATGMVLAQLELPADDARLVIQGHAFATNRSMMDVANDIVNRKLSFAQGPLGIESSS